MNVKLGSAPDSWGVWFPENEKQTPWERCLDEMEKAGYKGIELGPWGYLPNEYSKLKEELEKRDLTLTATTLVGDLTSNEKTDELIALLDEMSELQLKFSSAQYVVLIDDCYTDLFTGEFVRSPELNEQEWAQFVSNVDKIKNHAKSQYGLEVVFHPHAQSHIETEEQIERLLRDSNVNLCLDTGHHAYTDGDAVAFMKKHHARIPYLHLKSCDLEVRKRMQEEGWSFAKAVSEDIMCEPAKGVVDMEAFVQVLKDIKFNGWAIVEQDMYPAPFDKPYPIAKRTYDYLETLLRKEQVKI
ncbi:sugar phosphate isomerase/epimerase family protein [Halalkalibacter alkaliphilus]|uniref:Sugar phosphate isomerase/epimerase n=1 Tax=Halalkalibacter alkaliphilus TaxID=2917993 RepID=A0A9X2I5R4_9BACI|nr:sugar phosphate isomerase/epimerase [Halalkalibacter alkaliphilus]MCL7748492.1 sugar phosphate isomerase/epimerase [Halalkalibacter alkaliphilus]